jgi:hypothetical protein
MSKIMTLARQMLRRMTQRKFSNAILAKAPTVPLEDRSAFFFFPGPDARALNHTRENSIGRKLWQSPIITM